MSNKVRPQKQAVVLIHGVGEQVPMDTLRGFVKAVWESDPMVCFDGHPGQAWSKPDNISLNFELRRLTTKTNTDRLRTDFFEFYWAHLMQGTTFSQLGAWARVLLLRRPGLVPAQLRPLWWGLMTGLLVLVAGWAAYALGWRPGWLPWAGGAAQVLWFFAAGFLINYAGDAARYLHVAPPNIESRRVIREAGVQLLKSLHDARREDDSPLYRRIVIVGHSLGTVIGYDILTHLWPQYHEGLNEGKEGLVTALEALEALAREADLAGQPPPPDFAQRYQAAQALYLKEFAARGCDWRVTDFVTMGSPLAHGQFLLSRKAAEFKQKKLSREFPTCPPALEDIKWGDGESRRTEKKFSFDDDRWLPHHAAVFGPTRWTNLFFPCKAVLWGDFVGGPVAPTFGPGVRDVPVKTSILGGLVSHTFYWDFPNEWDFTKSQPPPDWIQSLRDAVKISERKAASASVPTTPTQAAA